MELYFRPGGSLDIKAQHRLLLQFPWEKADLLRSEQISSAVIPPLVGMVGRLGQHPASDDTSDTDSAGLATLIVEVGLRIVRLLSKRSHCCILQRM